MKRIVTLMLIAALALYLCACGNKDGIDTAAVKKEFDKAVAYSESLINTADMTPMLRDDSDGIYLYKRWGKDNFDNNADSIDIDMTVEIAGHNVTLGETTVGELKEMGFEIISGFETVQPGETPSVGIRSDGKICTFDAERNETDAAVSIEELRVTSFTGNTEDTNLPFSYKGIKAGSTLQEIVDVLGSPNYAASLSTDANGTDITMDYLSVKTEGKLQSSVELAVALRYDPKTDTAVLTGMWIDSDSYEAEEEPTEDPGDTTAEETADPEE